MESFDVDDNELNDERNVQRIKGYVRVDHHSIPPLDSRKVMTVGCG